MNEHIKRFFDEHASNWDQHERPNPDYIKSLLSLLDIQKHMDILDLACGTGVLTPYLLDTPAKKILGLDLSSLMIEEAKKKFPEENRLTFQCGDFYEGGFGLFDRIICFNAYPHFLDVDGFALKAKESLKEHGLLLIAHDLGREGLNQHHAAHAAHVSRHLASAKEEAEIIGKHLKVLKFEESKNHFLVLAEKK